MTIDNRPIGVFDSGVGGLTVLRSLIEKHPHENFIYLGDTARLPYGSKSPETIYRYSLQIVQYLKNQNVKAIVIACNSASSNFTETQFEGCPIFSVIEPGAQTALSVSKNKKVGVLGTRATVQSGSYSKTLHRLSETVEVFPQACPLFVPFAEEGLSQDPLTNLIAYRYVQPLVAAGVDTIILGCTHYPILKEAIQKAAGNSVKLVDSGEALSQKLENSFKDQLMARAEAQSRGKIQVNSTDASEHFEKLAQFILSGIPIDAYQTVDL